MSRRRSEWPEPWARLAWAPGDLVRLDAIRLSELPARDRRFVEEMRRTDRATLQQVAWLRRIARRQRAGGEDEKPARASRRYFEG